MSSSFSPIYTAASQFHSTAMDGHSVLKFSWIFAWPFPCKTRQIEKSSKFKSGKYGGQSVGVQNSTNSCWEVLTVWTSAKSAEWGIFCREKSPGPRGPNAISKALGRCWRRHDHQWKPASNSLNLQNCRSFRPGCYFSPMYRTVRFTPTFNSFFASKSMFLLLLRYSKIFILFWSTQNSE